jgi:hypothetical protein
MENDVGVSLAHPMGLTVKVASFPPDIINRLLPTFLDCLNETNRCDQKELSCILSGKAGLIIRLSALLWIRQTNFLHKVRTMSLEQGAWRFDAHYTLAVSMSSREDVDGYLTAARKHCEKQYEEASETGLTESIGVNTAFDPEWYFANLKEETLLFLSTYLKDYVKTTDVLRYIVEGGGDRKYNEVLRSYNMKERAAVMRFTSQFKKKGCFKNGQYKLVFVPENESQVRNKFRTAVAHFAVIEEPMNADSV